MVGKQRDCDSWLQRWIHKPKSTIIYVLETSGKTTDAMHDFVKVWFDWFDQGWRFINSIKRIIGLRNSPMQHILKTWKSLLDSQFNEIKMPTNKQIVNSIKKSLNKFDFTNLEERCTNYNTPWILYQMLNER